MNNDLISRSALLDEISREIDFERENNIPITAVAAFKIAMKRAKELPAVDAAPQWISVEDKLPENDIDVLVYGIGRGNSTETVIAMTSYTHNMYGYGIEGWRSPWEYFHRNYNITHWMLLPEPPHAYSEVNIDERKS